MKDDRVIYTAVQATTTTHSQNFLPMIQGALTVCSLTPKDVDLYAVTRGPGSFTGLRIGLASVKGLSWAADKPCIGISTLEGMAHPLRHVNSIIVCAMDARRSQIYNAVFLAENGTLTRLREDRAISLEEAAADIREFDGPITIVGDGAVLCHDYFTKAGIDCELAPAHLRQQSALGVAMATEAAGMDAAVSAQDLSPVYLRLSQAERERLARENANGN